MHVRIRSVGLLLFNSFFPPLCTVHGFLSLVFCFSGEELRLPLLGRGLLGDSVQGDFGLCIVSTFTRALRVGVLSVWVTIATAMWSRTLRSVVPVMAVTTVRSPVEMTASSVTEWPSTAEGES